MVSLTLFVSPSDRPLSLFFVVRVHRTGIMRTFFVLPLLWFYYNSIFAPSYIMGVNGVILFYLFN
jgi:hypothetical protein